MIELRLVESREQWDETILDAGGHPLQLWGWGEVKRKGNWEVFRYEGVVEGKVVAASSVLIRSLPFPFRCLAYVPRGPVTISREMAAPFLEALAHRLKKDFSPVVLTIEPQESIESLEASWRKSKNEILKSETISLDLSQSEDDLMAAMAKKTRQYIRKAASDGIMVRQTSSLDDLKTCLDLYEQTAERAGFALHDRSYYEDISREMDQHSPLFVAEFEGKIVAFLWMAVSADVAYELYGGMNDDGQRLRANYFLKWTVIQKMKRWGIETYDFGGLVSGGVSTFKQQWSEDTTILPGTYDLPLSPLYGMWARVLPIGKRIVQKLKRN